MLELYGEDRGQHVAHEPQARAVQAAGLHLVQRAGDEGGDEGAGVGLGGGEAVRRMARAALLARLGGSRP